MKNKIARTRRQKPYREQSSNINLADDRFEVSQGTVKNLGR